MNTQKNYDESVSCPLRNASEKLRVFISSAQRNENGMAWGETRRQIKQLLRQCNCLNPFIIEDEASVQPSTQLYQRQVERADIVVLLVKGDVRQGTLNEYALARTLKKPFLIYFIDDNNPTRRVRALKEDIERHDYCTYKIVSDIKTIPGDVYKDIMTNLVCTFQDKYHVSSLDTENEIKSYGISDNELFHTGILSKSELKKFNSCYNYLIRMLENEDPKEIKEESALHQFGCKLLQWLYSGEWKIEKADTGRLISEGKDIYNSMLLLEIRWKAIQAAIKGDYRKALAEEKRH